MEKDDRYAIPPKSNLPPKGRLAGYANQHSADDGPIDLIHVTQTAWIDQILDSKTLETQYCTIMNKNLVYFFVGHAAYRPKNGENRTSNLSKFPAAFLLYSDNLGTPWHVFPFDTGAAVTGRYPHDRTPSVSLPDFHLGNSVDSVRGFIMFAFGSNRNYLAHRLRDDLDSKIPRVVFEGRDYLAIARLASDTRNDLPDMRAATIEIAYDKHIPLQHNAKVLVLPDAMLEDPAEGDKLAQRISDLGLEIITYEWNETEPPQVHMLKVRRAVEQRLRMSA